MDILDSHLIYDILDILTLAIRLVAHSDPTGDHVGSLVAPLVNALPRSHCGALTSVALKEMPWIDIDFCSRTGDLDLLEFMLSDHTRRCRDGGCRPLNWSQRSLESAAVAGHVHVLDWWLNQRQFVTPFEWSRVAEWAAKSGRINVFDWWTRRCRPILGIELPPTLASMCGSFMTWFDKHGSVPREFECSLDVMRMWFPSDGARLQAGTTEDEQVDLRVFARNAARDGSVELLAWMLGAAVPLDWRMIVNEANVNGHTHVLDWMFATVSREAFKEACVKYVQGHAQKDFGVSSPRCVCKGLHYATWKADRMDALMDWWMVNAAGPIMFSSEEAYRAAFVCIRQGYTSRPV